MVDGVYVGVENNEDSSISKLWHMRLGHISEKGLDILCKQGLLDKLKKAKLDFCEHCVYGKQHRVKFGKAIHRTKSIVDYIHTDVWGPSKEVSKGGRRYFVTFIDDFSRRVWLYAMKTKDEVVEIFKIWKTMIETQTVKKVKRLRSDNGVECKNDPLKEYCQSAGIVRHWTVRKTAQQNGVAE